MFKVLCQGCYLDGVILGWYVKISVLNPLDQESALVIAGG